MQIAVRKSVEQKISLQFSTVKLGFYPEPNLCLMAEDLM
jgi:hypothetical protein